MTPYQEYFLPIFLSGCFTAGLLTFVAARMSGCVLPVVMFSMGVIAFWSALFIGSDLGYRAWQSMPDPPAEAFSDAFPAGALILGWLPGGLFCALIFGLVRGARWILSWANHDGDSFESSPLPPRIDAENPYRVPDR